MRVSIISATAHGVIDYLLVIFLLLSPTIFGLSPLVSTITYILAGIHFLLSILTAYKPGLVALIPLTLHGLIELVVGIVLLFLPWIFGFIDDPTGSIFYQILGIAVLLVWVFTDYGGRKKSGAKASG